MKTLITGATGFMGARLCKALSERGDEIRVLVLPGENYSHISPFIAEAREGDITNPASLVGVADGVAVVYHLAARKMPGIVLVLKGNKPLELRYSKRLRAVIYASDPVFLDAVLAGERGWVEIPLPPMSLVVFRHDDLSGYSREVFTFQAQARRKQNQQEDRNEQETTPNERS